MADAYLDWADCTAIDATLSLADCRRRLQLFQELNAYTLYGGVEARDMLLTTPTISTFRGDTNTIINDNDNDNNNFAANDNSNNINNNNNDNEASEEIESRDDDEDESSLLVEEPPAVNDNDNDDDDDDDNDGNQDRDSALIDEDDVMETLLDTEAKILVSDPL